MVKIIVAPDSFKGSLTQVEAAETMKRALLQVDSSSDIILKPMADGGEGTLETIVLAVKDAELLPITVTGPRGEKTSAKMGIIHGHTAVIEVAAIAGLTLIPEERRNPYETTTYGIGEAIRIGLDEGLREFIIGLGGSATNDGGLGMLLALGAMMKTKQQTPAGIFGADVLSVEEADLSSLDNRLSEAKITIASDVENPLFGPNGASAVFGPQKGATSEQIAKLDRALQKYSEIIAKQNNLATKLATCPGAGAAGGLGFAFMALGAKLGSGAKLVAEAIQLEKEMATADLVITGEGKSDAQTMYGKAPGFVAALAEKYAVPVLLLSGAVDDEEKVLAARFNEVHMLMDGTRTEKEAMAYAKMLLYNKTAEVYARWLKFNQS